MHIDTRIPDGPTRALAQFTSGLKYGALDNATRHAVRRHLLDTMGAAVAGSQGDAARIAERTLAEIGNSGDIPVPGMASRWNVVDCAYLMGASAHGLEVDDGYRAGSSHPGAPVIPAALVAAYSASADGRKITTAIAAGYEVATRVAEAVHPTSRRRGFHNTSIAGVFGATAATASILDFGADQCEQAFGIVASSAAGLFAFLKGGGEIKRLHPGFAAREGVFAALLARNGMTGPRAVLEIFDGFVQAFGGEGNSAALIDGLGDSFNVTRCYMKPYSCCRHIHPALDAVRNIMASTSLAPADIDRINVGTYAIAASHASGSWRDMASAQLSYQYCTAVAVIEGEVSLRHFDEAHLRDRAINALCAKVNVAVDAQCEADYPRLRSAQVEVVTRSGERHHAYLDEPRGSARYPLSDESVIEKFMDLATPVLGQSRSAALKDSIWSIEKLGDPEMLLSRAAKST